jgi:hypothetical protein
MGKKDSAVRGVGQGCGSASAANIEEMNHEQIETALECRRGALLLDSNGNRSRFRPAGSETKHSCDHG